jgi:hypothetical protein
MTKQLNIRSDEAYRLAHEIAGRRKVPVTEVVLQALRREAAPKVPELEELTPSQRADYDALKDASREFQASFIAGGRLLTDDDLYDENGLPR